MKSSARSIAACCVALAMFGCSHAVTSAERSRDKSPAPHAVQASAQYPGWAIFSPIGTPLLEIAAGFSTHVWALQDPTSASVLRVSFDGSYDAIAMPNKLSAPVAVAPGPHGDMWVAEWNGKIGEIAMPDGPIREFPFEGRDKDVIELVMGPDRNLWFVTRDGGAIGRMTPTGSVTEYYPHLMDAGEAIVVGPDGNLWFCGFKNMPRTYGGQPIVGKISVNGAITEYPILNVPGFAYRLAKGG
ncbi:MAG TPA: hypothetical protein VEV38_00890, partial [Candidatus Eremiobacteraceae bacterium]|nr:hypothetical protein [Candidatus Eremiobacteraceae bacterium]